MPDLGKIEEAVAAAMEITAERRPAWLDEFCAGDVELRREVDSLLAFAGDARPFLEQGVSSLAGISLDERPESIKGKLIGPYRLVREIGRGGMGSVYLAVRSDQEFNKRVAIKLLRRGTDTEDVLRRFRQERQILAALEHPFIARLLDGGMSADGLPYFAMEYVDGVALDRYCEEHALTTDDRIRLFIKVCSAVSYAHQNLVVHRDLKPSNILITKDGEPKLLDFGIAKFLNPELLGQTIAPTATFVRLMTPEFASPEQITGRNITTASDVYSLGVVLFKLLTGQNPHTFRNSSPQEIERVICEAEPNRPSDVARRTASLRTGDANRRVEVDPLAHKTLTGDLDNIILTALRKEPERRYRSAADLARDLQRYLDGRPVSARPNTLRYRADKFIRRNKIAVSAAALIVLAVLSASGVSIWQARVARIQRDLAQTERLKAEKISQFLGAALSYSDPSAATAGTRQRRDATINDMLDDFAPKIEADFADQPEIRAYLQRTVGVAYTAQLRFPEAERYLRAALTTYTELYGDEHNEIATSLAALGTIQSVRGDYAGAADLLEHACELYRRIPPQDQFHLRSFIDALNTLGNTYWTRGDYDAAEVMHREALALTTSVVGDIYPRASSKQGLGTSLYAKGLLDEATALLRETADELKTAPHLRWRLPEVLNFLGQVLTWKGQYEEALDVLRESERISNDLFGEANLSRARSLYLKVYALCFKGECREAEEVLRQSEQLYDRLLPENVVAKANNLDAKNIILTRTGRATDAEASGRESVRLYEAAMNRGAASITLARLHLAENLIAQRKYDQAEQILLIAYKDASEVQGAGHWRTKNVADLLASLYETVGNSKLASRYRTAAEPVSSLR